MLVQKHELVPVVCQEPADLGPTELVREFPELVAILEPLDEKDQAILQRGREVALPKLGEIDEVQVALAVFPSLSVQGRVG